MKTKLLFTAMLLIGLTSANATTANVASKGEDFLNTTRYRYVEPIRFMERGVEFLIFPDGSFDFNTNPGNSFGSYNDSFYYRDINNRRSSINTTHGAPGTVRHSSNYNPISSGILIQHDYDGKVRRIGNVFINYDHVGKVKRVGTVNMNYSRSGLLSQVGGLRLTYNHWGELVNSHGIVNTYNSNNNYGIGQGHAFGTYNHSDFDDSGDYYYYKQGDKIKKQKKIKK